MTKRLLIAATLVLLPAMGQVKPLPKEAPPVFRFGEWRVHKWSDDREADSKVTVQTDGFSFTLFNGNRVILGNTWPNCEWDTATYSVDGAKAELFMHVQGRAGICNSVTLNGRTFQAFRKGKSVQMRSPFGTKEYSLNGFAQALDKAVELSGTPVR